MTRTAVAIRHVAFEHLGTFELVLRSLGWTVQYIEAWSDDLAFFQPLAPDLLIVLGGPIGVYEDARYPFIKTELTILKARLAADKPTLGICLGSQLMARALGANVYPGQAGKEIGWASLTWTQAGKVSPWGALASMPLFHWHGDTFDLPEGAIRLASTERYANQIFQWRRHCVGFQCHPEVIAAHLPAWWVGHSVEIANTPDVDLTRLKLETKQYAPALEKQVAACFKTWLRDIELI